MLEIKSLKELFGRPNSSWEGEELSYLVYKNRFNEVKAYQVVVVFSSDNQLEVYDIEEEKIKTFKTENVLSDCYSFEEATEAAATAQKDFELIPRNKSGRTFANRYNLLEVCFTGFTKPEKEELIQLAKDNDMFVRTKVAKTLGLLVCGETSGWKKLELAEELGVSKVYGADGFRHFIETGEVSE